MFKEYDVIKLAAQKMIDDNFYILDTETMGLTNDDEIIELGIIDCKGNVLYEGMFRPEKEIHWAAAKVSGISNKMLMDKPLFKDEFAKIMSILNGHPVMAFNESFDERMFYQTGARYGLDTSLIDKAFSRSYCCQNLYDNYIGYKNTKLAISCSAEGIETKQDHRAVGDCLMTLYLVKSIAEPSKVPCLDKYIELKALDSGKTVEEVKESNEKRMTDALEKKVGVKGPSYLELFKSNKSIEEIAQIRNVRISTVESAIVDLYVKGQIDNIDFMIDEKYVQDILKLTKNPDWNGRLKPIKECLPEDCSYACIRAVIAKDGREGFSKKGSLESMMANAATRVSDSSKDKIFGKTNFEQEK